MFQKLNEQQEKAKPAKEKGQEQTHGRYELAARLQYGAGLRLSDLVRLRVQDVDPSPLRYAEASVGRGTLTVRQGKGDKDYPRF